MTLHTAASPDLLPGFADPVRQSQQCFRALLNAMARPGSIHNLPTPVESPAGWTAAMTAIALCLLDQDTPVWLDPPAATAQATAHLRFHCGCPIVESSQDATFAVVSSAKTAPPLHELSIGDAQYPERSATLLLSVAEFSGGKPLCWSGPGIESTADIAPRGLPAGFVRQWADNHALYPSGVDVLLIAGSQVIGLPRGIAIEEGF